MIIGIDQSKRSTAAVALNLDGSLKNAVLITPPKEIDKEDLIIYQWTILHNFLKFMQPTAIALEGAAFAAGGSSTDLLWGIQWFIRTSIKMEFPSVPIGIITPASWRASVVPIEEQRKFKLDYGGKIGLKHAVVSKLPKDVLNHFLEYVEKERRSILLSKGIKPEGRSNAHKEALFDLADAWGIAHHRYLISKDFKKHDKVKIKKESALKRRFPNAQLAGNS